LSVFVRSRLELAQVALNFTFLPHQWAGATALAAGETTWEGWCSCKGGSSYYRDSTSVGSTGDGQGVGWRCATGRAAGAPVLRHQ